MNYRTLGKTGLKVSEVGYGTWAIANDEGCWSGADLNESLKSLSRYVELGGNFLDTASIYGFSSTNPCQHGSEELIGKFLRQSGKRDKVHIASKIYPKNMKWPAWRAVPISEVFPASHIEHIVNESLRSLNIETLDLMQFHVWQDDFVKEDEWKKTIDRITKAGKVKHWGISINDYQPTNCLRTLDTGLISTIQTIFNIFHQRPTEKLLPYAKEHNIGIIARVPLDEGGLTGNITSATRFNKGEFRADYFTPERLLELDKHVLELEKLIGNEVKTLPELALRFILSHDEVSTVIPGMRKLKNVETNTAVSDAGKLSQELMTELKKQTWERNFYPDVDPSMAPSYLE
ncbi:MAG: aldo/keto reductase [Candidatus Vogelbacteria bacterium]|nr:aldo/keto reductase [Candidatus Vogelbacteria bacterium]